MRLAYEDGHKTHYASRQSISRSASLTKQRNASKMYCVVATSWNSYTIQPSRRTTSDKWTFMWYWSCTTVIVARSQWNLCSAYSISSGHPALSGQTAQCVSNRVSSHILSTTNLYLADTPIKNGHQRRSGGCLLDRFHCVHTHEICRLPKLIKLINHNYFSIAKFDFLP